MTESSSNSSVQFTWRSGHEVLDVRLPGHTTATGAQALLDSLCHLPRCGAVHVVVDCSAVTEIDRAAAAAILDAHVNTTLRGGTFELVGLSADVREMLREAGVLQAMDAPRRTGGRQLRLVHGNRVAHPATQVPS